MVLVPHSVVSMFMVAVRYLGPSCSSNDVAVIHCVSFDSASQLKDLDVLQSERSLVVPLV